MESQSISVTVHFKSVQASILAKSIIYEIYFEMVHDDDDLEEINVTTEIARFSNSWNSTDDN